MTGWIIGLGIFAVLCVLVLILAAIGIHRDLRHTINDSYSG
jgi:hypothetical protein